MPFAIQDKKILNKCKLIWNKKSYYILKKNDKQIKDGHYNLEQNVTEN